MRYIISGGGTGGHIFPAISIAHKIEEVDKEAVLLFVGANDRMEMTKIPQEGYEIVGLPISGLNRQKFWRNIITLYNFVRSLYKVHKVLCSFRPDVCVGVGGYASAATMKMAAWMGIPILIQEQNSYAGVTNKFLRHDASYICVAYEGMERFFPRDKIVLTGNPVRHNIMDGDRLRGQSLFFPSLPYPTKTVLVIGGSLGARSINEAVIRHVSELVSLGYQLIWQTGKNYYDDCLNFLDKELSTENRERVSCLPFIDNMADAYAIADIVVSRAGAGTISELCLLSKAAILVPSPNVAEDHQTHNATALTRHNAAILIPDSQVHENLISTIISLFNDEKELRQLETNIRHLGKSNADIDIAKLVIQLAHKNHV